MTSGITVADARTLLAGYVSPEDLNSSKFLSYLNQVRERIINSGKWRGTTFKVVFDTTRDYITLPREAEALLGIHISTAPYPIQSGWFEYLQGGPGKLDNPDNASANARDFGTLIDMGDNFCTLEDIATPATIGFSCLAAADDNLGLTVNIQGLGANGLPIYDSQGRLGETLSLDQTIQYTTAVFSRITNVSMPVTFGQKRIYLSGTPTTLSTYAPSETNPQYRRYRLPATDKTVIGTCKMRFLPLMGESEPVIPNNIGALKMGLMALNYEDVNDMATAETFWGKCFTLLDDQMREHRGSARYVPNIKFFPGNANPIPTVI
jgi:hypothetical protein